MAGWVAGTLIVRGLGRNDRFVADPSNVIVVRERG